MIRHPSEMRCASRYRWPAIFFALILCSVFSAAQSSDNWKQPVRELVGKILARASQPSSVFVTVRNISSLSPAEVEQIRAQIEAEFRAAGAQITPQERALAEVGVTLSENAAGYLWIAQIGHRPTPQMVMQELLRSQTAVVPQISPSITLRKQQVWSQNDREPLLDFALFDGGSKLLTLEPSFVSLYRNQQSRWELEQSQPIARSKPWPRDVRGRMLLHSDHKVEVYLPGKKCTGAVDPGITLECGDSDDPWPLGSADQPARAFLGARNFFTGALSGVKGESNAPPFFSAAVGPGDDPIMLLAATDGTVRDRQGRTLAADAGSDIAGVKSGCGSGWQVFTTAVGDQTKSDTTRAIEIAEGSLRTVGTALEFPGPITALWTRSDGTAADAVVRDLTNGRYEAYLISIDCR